MGSTAVAENLTIPPWLNAEFLSDVLSKDKDRDVSVIDLDVKPAVPKGDNYLSTLYRVKVEYTEDEDEDDVKNSFLIVKTLPVGDVIQKILSDLQGFEKEVHMYETVLPAMYDIMKSATGKIHPLSAKTLPCGEENIIILEDLQHLDFKMANRQTGLDLEHCKLAVRALARLHSLSLALYKVDPSIMDVLCETFYVGDEEKRKVMEPHIKSNMSTLASKVENWPGYEHYAEKIMNLIPSALDEMVEAVSPNNSFINVLNHGDCWVNNMMFHYCPETGKVDDVRFVDFQIARFSSPALDLQYFICNSPTDEVRFQQRDILLEEYHDELSECFRNLDIEQNQFTLTQLKEEFEKKDMFGFITACTILCAVLAQKEDAPDLSEIKEDHVENGEPNVMDKAFSGKRYREVFQQMLVFYENKGLI